MVIYLHIIICLMPISARKNQEDGGPIGNKYLYIDANIGLSSFLKSEFVGPCFGFPCGFMLLTCTQKNREPAVVTWQLSTYNMCQSTTALFMADC